MLIAFFCAGKLQLLVVNRSRSSFSDEPALMNRQGMFTSKFLYFGFLKLQPLIWLDSLKWCNDSMQFIEYYIIGICYGYGILACFH
jgi:hypothetical protein